MAIQGSYRINFTDPKNGSFVIEPYTVNGNVTPTSDMLHKKATRANTSLQLPGQYVPNYGELVHEDLVHLLENFSGDTAPTTPIEGQLWYDTGDSFSIVDLSNSGCTISGNHSAQFGNFIANATSLTAWYGPVSATDNSYNSITFKATTVLVTAENNTVVEVTATDGTALTFPNTAVGGFITLTSSSRNGRLKVAVKVNNELTWSDVVNVICSNIAPTENVQDGDLWFDLTAQQLKVRVSGAWISLTAGYLPLTGGTMTGTLNMGANPVVYSGLVTADTHLANKVYVDDAITAAVAPLIGDTEQQFEEIVDRVEVIEAVLPDKVNKAGDNIRGVLTFGPNGTPSVLTRGLDMVDNPIINPSITWSPADYLTAVGETHNAVDKNYVAMALKQHLLDALHGGKVFIEEQVDGTGLITESLFFADVGNKLTFEVNNTSYGLSVDSDSLIFSTGALIDSNFVFKQTGAPTSLFEIGDSAVRSYNSIYLFDGQPQPTFSGTITAENEDTKVATKGYVIDAISDAQSATNPVTAANFGFSVEAGPYNLNLVRAGTTDIVVDLNHSHKSEKVIHNYEKLLTWKSGKADLVGLAIGNPTQTPINNMLSALNRFKAPTSGAKFDDAPTVGTEDRVVEINDADSSFELLDTDPSWMPVGTVFTIVYTDTGTEVNVQYTVTSITTITDPLEIDDDRYFYLTSPALPLAHDLVAKPMTCRIPLMDDGKDQRSLLNRASVNDLMHDYVDPFVATSIATAADANRYKPVVTNTTTALTLALTHANKYLRMDNAAATALTVPPQASVVWLADTEIEVRNAGAGKVTLTPGAGVTLNPPFGKTLVMQGLGATVKLKRVASNEWDVTGDTETI